MLIDVSVASELCSWLSTELSELSPPRVLLIWFVRSVICCCGAAWRALTRAVTMELTSRPEPIPSDVMVPPAELLELLEDELPDELLEPVLVLPVSWLSSELKLLPDVALDVVIALPCLFPAQAPSCDGELRAPGKTLVIQGLCRWLP